MSEDEFTKLYKLYQLIVEKLDTKTDRSQVDHLQTTLDGLVKRFDDDDAERERLF